MQCIEVEVKLQYALIYVRISFQGEGGGFQNESSRKFQRGGAEILAGAGCGKLPRGIFSFASQRVAVQEGSVTKEAASVGGLT